MTPDQIVEAREVTHGSFAHNSEAFARLNDALPIDSFDPLVQYAIGAIYLKLARIHSGRALSREHWEDVAGYAIKVVEMIEEGQS